MADRPVDFFGIGLGTPSRDQRQPTSLAALVGAQGPGASSSTTPFALPNAAAIDREGDMYVIIGPSKRALQVQSSALKRGPGCGSI